MRKESYQEDKARSELLEQIGSLRTKLFWVGLAAFLVLATAYAVVR